MAKSTRVVDVRYGNQETASADPEEQAVCVSEGLGDFSGRVEVREVQLFVTLSLVVLNVDVSFEGKEVVVKLADVTQGKGSKKMVCRLSTHVYVYCQTHVEETGGSKRVDEGEATSEFVTGEGTVPVACVCVF